MFASFGALVAGFERFGRNNFDTPIVSTSRDELADVATHANKMAEQLQRFDLERARNEWVRSGLVGLNDELRGELDPSEIAARSVSYLARYLEAPVGALYHGPATGPYELIGRFALTSDVPTAFARGEGIVGQAATRTDITVVDGTADSRLHAAAPVSSRRPRDALDLLATRPR